MTEPTAAERAKELLGDKVNYLPDGLYYLQPSMSNVIAALEAHAAAAVEDWRALCKAQENLLVCYRTGRQAPGKLLDTIRTLKERLEGATP